MSKLKAKRREIFTDSNLLFLIAVCIFVFLYIFAIVVFGGGFHRFQQFFNLFDNLNAALIILACGLSIVMVAGGIDISVGGVTALATMVCASFLNSGSGNIFGSILIALGVGLAFGLLQGFFVVYLDIQPFIITMAGMFLSRGIATVISKETIRIDNPEFANLINTKLKIDALGYTSPNNGAWIPLSIGIGAGIMLIVVLAVIFVMKWTRFGRNLYAVGGNNQSALMLGINVKRTKFFAYVTCGVLAGIAGFVYILSNGAGYANSASAYEMKAIASSIIGGTMLTGGVGNIIGSPFGVMILMTIETIVASTGLALTYPWLQTVTTGAMLCIAILIQSVVLSGRGKGGATFKWLKPKSKPSADSTISLEK